MQNLAKKAVFQAYLTNYNEIPKTIYHKKTLSPCFMDMVQLSQGYTEIMRSHFIFYDSVPKSFILTIVTVTIFIIITITI